MDVQAGQTACIDLLSQLTNNIRLKRQKPEVHGSLENHLFSWLQSIAPIYRIYIIQ